MKSFPFLYGYLLFLEIMSLSSSYIDNPIAFKYNEFEFIIH